MTERLSAIISHEPPPGSGRFLPIRDSKPAVRVESPRVSAVAALVIHPATSFAGAPEVYEQLKSLVGEWEAELPGFGKLTSSVRLVSNGKAIEEVIGTPKDNELSVYTLNADKILLTHY